MTRALAYQPENALNAICPYFTMFPLEYPLRVLKTYRREAPVVMDPFCGRGTTLFAARKLGLVARGIDSSPIAIAIARAKLAVVDVDAVLELAQAYIAQYERAETPEPEFFRHAFAPPVLQQVCASHRSERHDPTPGRHTSLSHETASSRCSIRHHGQVDKPPSRLVHTSTWSYGHQPLSPLVSTRNGEGPLCRPSLSHKVNDLLWNKDHLLKRRILCQYWHLSPGDCHNHIFASLCRNTNNTTCLSVYLDCNTDFFEYTK